MKKIIALAAIMAVAPAFAAHNTFTFKVNSSGAETYVCGFEIYNGGAATNQQEAGLGIPQYSGSSVTWTEASVDTWDGTKTVTENDTHTEILSGYSSSMPGVTRDYSSQKLGSLDKYTSIDKLTFNLSDEFFGVEYAVKICYNVPLFYDLDKVTFKVAMQSAFVNMSDAAGDYLAKAKIQSNYEIEPIILRGSDTITGERAGNFIDDTALVTHQAVTNFVDSFITFNQQLSGDEAVIVATYKYKENSKARRPHVKHGGEFTVNTTFTPVAKLPASN